MRVWAVPLAQAGFQLHRPSFTMFSGVIRNKCGVHNNQTHYCHGDQQIYMSTATISDRRDFDYVAAHEFAHLIQDRIGVLYGVYYFEYYERSTRVQDEWRRRLELQADCFVGISVNSLTQALQLDGPGRQSFVDRRARRGSAQHGYGPVGAMWLTRGLGSAAMRTCNTFIVPSSQVPER